MQFEAVEWYETLPSTNTTLKERLCADRTLGSGQVVAARRQTAGRGRYARTWRASENTDLTFSFLLRAPVETAWLPLLPMAVSLGVSDYLTEVGLAPRVKWPNDVLVGGRKICGILSEFVPEAGTPHALVVGVGLNLGMTPDQAARIDRPATSVYIESGVAPEPTHALEALLPKLAPWIDRWEASGYAGLRNAWETRATGVGQRAVVGEGEGRREGVILGFDDQGALLLREENGHLAVVTMGDVILAGSAASQKKLEGAKKDGTGDTEEMR